MKGIGLFFTAAGLWMPREASTVASRVDSVYWFIFWLSAFFFVAIIFTMVLFAWKYRDRGDDRKTSPLAHNTKLEIFWSVIPGVLLLVMFGWGFRVWLDMTIPPGDSLEVRVYASRWKWSFGYPKQEGIRSAQLIIPKDKSIKLVMISSDVIHSFFAPELRIKRDVLPNRYTVVWFKIDPKSLNRLEKVSASDKKLSNVLQLFGWAVSKADAEALISSGRVVVNGKVEKNPGYTVKLDDIIQISVPKELAKAVSSLDKSYSKKIAESDKNSLKSVVKEYGQKFKEKAPQWLQKVLLASYLKKFCPEGSELYNSLKGSKDALEKVELKSALWNRAVQTYPPLAEELIKSVEKGSCNQKKVEWVYSEGSGLNSLWGFVSDSLYIACAEYCGREHSRMVTRIRPVSPKVFAAWVKHVKKSGISGKALFSRYGCNQCHSVDGSVKVGPSLKGIYGKVTRVLDKKDNKVKEISLKGDTFAQYIRESLLKPQAKIVVGFENAVMPTFQGQIKADEIDLIIDYLKTLK